MLKTAGEYRKKENRTPNPRLLDEELLSSIHESPVEDYSKVASTRVHGRSCEGRVPCMCDRKGRATTKWPKMIFCFG